jgi:hypothetical protein
MKQLLNPTHEGRHLISQRLVLCWFALLGLNPSHDHMLAFEARYCSDLFTAAATDRYLHT